MQREKNCGSKQERRTRMRECNEREEKRVNMATATAATATAVADPGSRTSGVTTAREARARPGGRSLKGASK